jgi:hypothetical protein
MPLERICKIWYPEKDVPPESTLPELCLFDKCQHFILILALTSQRRQLSPPANSISLAPSQPIYHDMSQQSSHGESVTADFSQGPFSLSSYASVASHDILGGGALAGEHAQEWKIEPLALLSYFRKEHWHFGFVLAVSISKLLYQ